MSVKFGMFPQADLSASFFAGVGDVSFLGEGKWYQRVWNSTRVTRALT
jgi:hypothetical protein